MASGVLRAHTMDGRSVSRLPVARAVGLLIAFLVVGAGLAGCLGPDTELETPPGTEAMTLGPEGNLTAPEPVIYTGTAVLGQPLHSAYCIKRGVDGEIHSLHDDRAGWWFAVEPADTFLVYWWKGNVYIQDGSGQTSGTVPEDATQAEVCRTRGLGASEYTLVLIHPAHPQHPEHGDNETATPA